MPKNTCATCGQIYDGCPTCNKATNALFWRSKCCSPECFISYMEMRKGENKLDIQVMLTDKKTYLIEKINKNSVRLKHIDKTVKPEEILCITYCPVSRLHELTHLFTKREEEA